MPQRQMQCFKGCGTLIHFDDYHVSKSGKKIPLESNGDPHQCPNSDFNQGRPRQDLGDREFEQQPPQRNTASQVLQQQRQPSAGGDLTSFMNDTAASLQALHMKIDKLLEVHTVTNTVEFRKAESMKNNHGNEISGSDAASSGLGVAENPVHITDEQPDEEYRSDN
jgi:hypothetical protein